MTVQINPQDILPGTISETEFGYLNGVTSNIQIQIDARLIAPAAPIDGTFIRYNGANWVGVTDINLVGDLEINSANHYIGLAAKADLIALSATKVTVDGTIEVTDGIIIGDGINGETLNIGNIEPSQLTFETDGTLAAFGLKVGANSLSFCRWDGTGNLEFVRGASNSISCFEDSQLGETESFQVWGRPAACTSRYLDISIDTTTVDSEVYAQDIRFANREGSDDSLADQGFHFLNHISCDKAVHRKAFVKVVSKTSQTLAVTVGNSIIIEFDADDGDSVDYRLDEEYFTHDPTGVAQSKDQVIVREAGWYKWSYGIYWVTQQNERISVEAYLTVDGAEKFPTHSLAYIRSTGFGLFGSNTASNLMRLDIGDIVRLVAENADSDAVTCDADTVINKVWLTLEKVDLYTVVPPP